jgi:IS30 family transposase
MPCTHLSLEKREEIANGQLRQYLPRNIDLATVTARQLNQIAADLNERPHETLVWMASAECPTSS